MRPVHLPSYPRALHPGAWWLWALGLAAAATRTTNPVVLLLLVGVAGFVVVARRSRAPWADTFSGFLKLGLLVVVIRIVLQAVLSSESQGVHVIVSLPQVPLPNWADGVQIGGPITWEAVLTAFAAGLQLATIICCVGAANALASSQRLLRSVPGALYEIGVAAVVAMTFAPQLATDAARVRLASRLRGYDGHGVAAMRRVAMPVFEGALSRSVALAAAMDSRGYGRSFERPTARRLTAALVLGGLLGVCVGVYGLLGAAPRWLGLPVLAAGCLLAAGGLAAGGRRTRRTRYRPDPWALPEWAVSASGIACAAAVFVLGWLEPQAASPPYPLAVPALPVLALVGPLLGLLPAIAAPPPPDRLRRPLPAEASEQGPNGSPGRGSAAPETAR